jgi:hypothetical protein
MYILAPSDETIYTKFSLHLPSDVMFHATIYRLRLVLGDYWIVKKCLFRLKIVIDTSYKSGLSFLCPDVMSHATICRLQLVLGDY